MQLSVFVSSTSFFLKVASLLKIAILASLLWYLREDLILLGRFDRNVGLTTKRAMVKVSVNILENEPLTQTRVNITNKKNKMSRGGHLRRSYFTCDSACAAIIFKRLR